MQKENKQIFEDTYFETILESTFITGEEKIEILEKCIELLDDNSSKTYLNLWKNILENILQNAWKQNCQGTTLIECINKYRLEKKGEATDDNTYVPKMKDAKLNLSNWFHKGCHEIYKQVYTVLELGDVMSFVEAKETLIKVTNKWDLSSVSNYYQMPYDWIKSNLEVKENPTLEQIGSIKVNIISSHFICIFEKLHELRLIELPTHEGPEKKINQKKSSEILLKIFKVFSNAGTEVTDPILLSNNFLKKERSSNVVTQIEKSINEISNVVSHIKLKPKKKEY